MVINSVSYAQARSSSINTTINLSALIPATEINNTLKSRILDGANRKLSYDINSGKFNSVYFNVRTESSEITFPGNYAFTEVFNNLSCSSLSKNESFRFDVKINDKTLSSGNLVMNGPNLWYRGDDRFYSDTVIEMLSPLISDNEKKWCSGNVVLIVHKAL
ncbi:hypothetical protein ABXV24_04090 [Vibrio owensii]|uniref:hypothetical protein n=1 Tax=Vibrio owensii TaxID=696485 RepID=UPI0033914FA7